MNYGFIIDNRRCIGCHACSVACKAEQKVPLGSFRTWVKSVEKGSFPDVRRHFTVLRCNHCEDAPCVNICPTASLYHRSDGIVDFNSTHCIGCRSCMAACPYDALYMDAETRTAAKCNYCSHRIEIGIEPPCVTVCPGQAIIAGDMDDVQSTIHILMSEHRVSTRKPEYDTRPRVSYIEGEPAVLVPEEAEKAATYAWAQRTPGEEALDFPPDIPNGSTRVSYDVPHEKPWNFRVSLSLWLQLLAAGPVLVAALLGLLHHARAPLLFGVFAPGVTVTLTLVALLFLIGDLRRPARFLKIILHPNWRSWQMWGASTLLAFAGVAFLWFAAGLLRLEQILRSLLWPGFLSAVMTAGYPAFLFGQARARDLWQSRLLFPHLLVQAFLAGSAVLLLSALFLNSGNSLTAFLSRCLLAALCAHAALVLGMTALPDKNVRAGGAVKYMLQGPLGVYFWLGAGLTGMALPVYLLALHIAGWFPGVPLPPLAAILSLAGLLAYEDCHVRAGQALPLS